MSTVLSVRLEPINVVFHERGAEITGTITDSAGRPVQDLALLVFPTDPQKWIADARGTRVVRPDMAGSYAVRDLPAGTYYLAALMAPHAADLRDPIFLKQVAAAGFSLVLGSGERKIQNIRVPQ